MLVHEELVLSLNLLVRDRAAALHKQVVRSLVLSLNLLVRDRAAALHRQVVRSEWQMQKAL